MQRLVIMSDMHTVLHFYEWDSGVKRTLSSDLLAVGLKSWLVMRS